VARARGIFGGCFEVAAGLAVVLGSAFSSQATTCFDRQLLTPAYRQLHVLRQFWLLAVVAPMSGHPCIGSADIP